MSYNPQNPNGQATSANSSPVVVASDQSAVPVKVQDGSGNAITSTSSALDVNIKTNAATNQSVNVAQIAGGTTITGGVTGSQAVGGPTTSGASLTANPLTVGGLAKTALPTAVSDGQVVNRMHDKFGRQVILSQTTRDLIGTQTTTISASTSETTIVTAAASTFNDLMMLIISNTSASTNTRIDFRDTTAGTILFSLESIGGAAPVGFSLGGVAIPQTTVNTNWTAQCATSTTDVRIYAVFAKNK